MICSLACGQQRMSVSSLYLLLHFFKDFQSPELIHFLILKIPLLLFLLSSCLFRDGLYGIACAMVLISYRVCFLFEK